MRWRDNIRHDKNKCGLEERDAQDRRRWKCMAQNPYLASKLQREEDEEGFFVRCQDAKMLYGILRIGILLKN